MVYSYLGSNFAPDFLKSLGSLVNVDNVGRRLGEVQCRLESNQLCYSFCELEPTAVSQQHARKKNNTKHNVAG